MLYLAIDQHRKQLTVNLRDEDGRVLVQRQVSTRWQAVREFLQDIQERGRHAGGWMVIVEVCGFNDWLLKLLVEYGAREIVLLHAEDRQRQKTDRRDADRLGELLWLNRQRLAAGLRVQGIRRVVIPSPDDQLDRKLTSLRWRIGRERTRLLNRIKGLLRRHNLEQACPTQGIARKKAVRWLRELVLGELDRLELDQLLARLETVDAEREALEAKIRARQARNPAAAQIATVPGMGAYISLTLACRVGDIGRFPRPRSLANYWGLAPSARNSGEAKQRLGSITKQGSALARFVLGQAVLHVLRKDALLRDWYKGIKRRRGSKIARVAVMRRLATIIWHLLRKQQPYVLGGPRLRAERPRKAMTAMATPAAAVTAEV
jgi:transposase